MAEGEVVEAVRSVFGSVDRVATETAPLLASMFGGTAGHDAPFGREWFWHRYSETMIAVETSPGRWVDLNGPDAVESLPLGTPLHIISAWDPGGRLAPPDDNERAQAALVAELWTRRCAVLRSSGRSPDGAHADEGVFVFGLDRKAARSVGARFGQDAVFEVDATTVSVVSRTSEHVTTVPRNEERTGEPSPDGTEP